MKCPKCNVPLKEGTALVSTLTGLPDFPGDKHATTVSPGGPGQLVAVYKCPSCGYSIRK